MRMQREKKPESSWSKQDILSHLAEEEDAFKSRMRPDRFAALVRHHNIIRAQLRNFNEVNQKFFKYHAELEDKWVREMAEGKQ